MCIILYVHLEEEWNLIEIQFKSSSKKKNVHDFVLLDLVSNRSVANTVICGYLCCDTYVDLQHLSEEPLREQLWNSSVP